MVTERNSEACRKRLIETAGEVFGEVGFRGATIREIAKRAGLGLGIVNYHFRDKRGLYRAVCAHAFAHSMGDFERELAGVVDPEERLGCYVRVFLHHVLDEGRPEWHGRIFMHGMSEPNSGLANFVRTLIRPHHELLVGILRDLLGPRASNDDVLEHSFVIVGQCLVHNQSREVIALLRGRRYDVRDVERLTERVTRIALAGIAAERRRSARTPRKTKRRA